MASPLPLLLVESVFQAPERPVPSSDCSIFEVPAPHSLVGHSFTHVCQQMHLDHPQCVLIGLRSKVHDDEVVLNPRGHFIGDGDHIVLVAEAAWQVRTITTWATHEFVYREPKTVSSRTVCPLMA